MGWRVRDRRITPTRPHISTPTLHKASRFSFNALLLAGGKDGGVRLEVEAGDQLRHAPPQRLADPRGPVPCTNVGCGGWMVGSMVQSIDRWLGREGWKGWGSGLYVKATPRAFISFTLEDEVAVPLKLRPESGPVRLVQRQLLHGNNPVAVAVVAAAVRHY